MKGKIFTLLKNVKMENLNFKFVGTIALISALTFLAMHYAVLPAIDKD